VPLAGEVSDQSRDSILFQLSGIGLQFASARDIAADAQHFVVSHCFGPFLAARGRMVMVAQSPL
jgi:hypothetical protein